MFNQWLSKWQGRIPHEAIADLYQMLGVDDHAPSASEGGGKGSESRQQSLVRMDAAQAGVWLTRNNVGVLMSDNGTPVRYGLANESKEQNKVFKSSDLIGIRAVLVTQAMVGQVIGQFVARECKKEGWRYSGDHHETAQLAFINFINAKGGDACFASGPGTFKGR